MRNRLWAIPVALVFLDVFGATSLTKAQVCGPTCFTPPPCLTCDLNSVLKQTPDFKIDIRNQPVSGVFVKNAETTPLPQTIIRAYPDEERLRDLRRKARELANELNYHKMNLSWTGFSASLSQDSGTVATPDWEFRDMLSVGIEFLETRRQIEIIKGNTDEAAAFAMRRQNLKTQRNYSIHISDSTPHINAKPACFTSDTATGRILVCPIR